MHWSQTRLQLPTDRPEPRDDLPSFYMTKNYEDKTTVSLAAAVSLTGWPNLADLCPKIKKECETSNLASGPSVYSNQGLTGALSQPRNIRSIPEIADQMKKLLRVLPIILVLAGAALLSERAAYAYADPGTGLLAVQAVGSVLVATGWYLRRKISSLLRWGAGSKDAAESYPVADDKGPTSQ